MNTIDGGYLYKGGDYSVAIVVKNRRTGRTILERELLATEIVASSVGDHVMIDVKTS